MKSGRELHNLRGPVAEAQIDTFEFKEQDGHRVEQFWYGLKVTFNRDGQLVEIININRDGTSFRAVNNYSVKGKVTSTKHHDADAKLMSERLYHYDHQGRLISEQIVTPTHQSFIPVTHTYTFDGRRTKIEKLEQPADGGLLIGVEGTDSGIIAGDARTVETDYDERSEAVRVRAYNGEGVLICRIEIARNEAGNVLEQTQYIGDITPFSSICSPGGGSQPEAKAQLTEEQKAEMEAEFARLFAPGSIHSREVYRYDEQGRLIERTGTMIGLPTGHRTFAYNEHGDISEEVSFDGEGRLQSKAVFTRRYDERGNWIEEQVSTGSAWDAEFSIYTPLSVTRRKLVYFSD